MAPKEMIQIVLMHLGFLVAFLTLHVTVFKFFLVSERQIFFFHVALFIALPLLTSTVALICGLQITVLTAVALYGLSAIYALSFLELWSLTQGGYSLQILRALETGRSSEAKKELVRIGEAKLTDRVQGILGLGLARRNGQSIEITRLGFIISCLTSALATAAGAKMRE